MILPLFGIPMLGYDRVKASALRFVEAMKLGELPWLYRKEPGGSESFYGSYHALHILDMLGGLDSLSQQERDDWAGYTCADQLKDGLFRAASGRDRPDSSIDSLEPHWHCTRGHLWALRILDRPPRYRLRFIEPLLDARALCRWVKKYDWNNSWAAGNQVLGSWFYPLSIALIAHLLRDTGYEGPYRLNPMSLHESNVFSLEYA